MNIYALGRILQAALLITLFRLTSNATHSQELFWQRMNINSATEITTIASNPRGDIFAGDQFGFSPGIYRSTDNGEHWSTSYVDKPITSILSLWIEPQTDDSARRGVIFACADSGIYCSSDNGERWQKRSSLYAEALIHVDTIGSFLAGNRGGVYQSADTCRTWVLLTPDSVSYSYVYDLAITRQGSILAVRHPFAGYRSILRSTDNGQTWTRPLTWSDGYARQLLVPPEGDIFLVGSDGVNRSSDDGQTWYWSNNGIPSNVAYYMQSFAMDSNRTIYAGSGSYGVY